MAGNRWFLWGVLFASTLLAGCASQPTFSEGNRYVVAGNQALAQACLADSPSRKWAVVIGVDFYQDDRIPDLSGAVNDAWSFYHFLASPAGGGVDPFRIKLLLNDEATSRGVEEALGEFLEDACAQDEIIIYFAGHGAPEPDRPDEVFLLVNDTELDKMVSTAISMRRLPGFLKDRAGHTGKLLMLIDACHSGNIQFPGKRGVTINTAAGLKQEAQDRAKNVNSSIDDIIKNQEGWGAISATASDQLAGESVASCELGGQEYAGGIFTCYMLDGLSGAADNNDDNNVTLKELFAHLKSGVQSVRGADQVPQRSGQLDDEMVLVNSKDLNISIPRVPERYKLEDPESALQSWAWATAGLSVATFGAGIFFNLQANTDSKRLDDFDNRDGLKADYKAIEDERTQNILLATTGYLAAAALTVTTFSLLSWDIIDQPESIEDVYEDKPWFELSVSPQKKGASLQLKMDY